MVPPLIVPLLRRKSPLAAVRASVLAALSRVPAMVTVPPLRVKAGRLTLAVVKLPLSSRLPPLTLMVPVLDQLPARVIVPPPATESVPLLDQVLVLIVNDAP